MTAAKGRTRDAVAAQQQLTDRDHTLLQLLADHQVLTTEQIARMLFASQNVARKRLVLLTRRDILNRFRHCQRPGSQSWRYTLGPLGAAIHTATTNTNATLPTAAKTHERTLKLARSPRLDHLLGVNDFFSHLAADARTTPGHTLDTWLSERAATDACARIVRPDGYGHWTAHNPHHSARHVGFFLEYDTGTEKLGTVLDKLTGYRSLADAGIHQPILFVFHSPRREHHFQNALPRHTATRRLTIATTTRAATEPSPAGAIWHLPDADTPRVLLDLPTPPP